MTRGEIFVKLYKILNGQEFLPDRVALACAQGWKFKQPTVYFAAMGFIILDSSVERA